MDSSEVTVAALKGSEHLRRSRVARRIQIALVVAGCYVLYVFMEQRTKVDAGPLDRALPGALVDAEGIATRTITLQCINPEQAMSLATPYLRSKGVVYTVPGIPAVIVRGKRDEFRRVVGAIEQFDVQCQLPHATTEPPATSPARPGKD
jgi:type II secretory pathway component GspD/PulD (secretin)